MWEWLIFILCTQLDPRVKITLDGYSKSMHDKSTQPYCHYSLPFSSLYFYYIRWVVAYMYMYSSIQIWTRYIIVRHMTHSRHRRHRWISLTLPRGSYLWPCCSLRAPSTAYICISTSSHPSTTPPIVLSISDPSPVY